MLNSSKSTLRRLVSARLKALTQQQTESANRLVAETAMHLPEVARARRILAYRPLKSIPEIDPTVLLNRLGQAVVIDFVASTADTTFPTEQYDLILVPVLGFDTRGFRLGHGAGWYDRFLTTQPQAYRLGLAFSQSFLPGGIPNEPHDIPLSRIIHA